MASRQTDVRRCGGVVVPLALPAAAAAQARRRLGALGDRDCAALALSPERAGAPRLGAQHPAGRVEALLGDLPNLRRGSSASLILELDPDRRVVAALLPAAYLAVDAGCGQARGDRG